MGRVTTFADESGNFDFSKKPGATRYYILTAVSMADCTGINAALNDLRHALAWEGIAHPGPFHACMDPAPTRERVFAAIAPFDFRVDAVVLEKSKAQPQVRRTDARFYQYGWFYLMRHVVPRITTSGDELLAVAASIGTKKKEAAFYAGVADVMAQVAGVRAKTACWPAAADPCLQVADYCCWAVSRKWERGDGGPYGNVAAKVKSEYDLWSYGRTHYY